ncbi:MAG: flap endonuclease-1 [Candidatus Huberarchaeum crystalense]|uniref:Flap endonuclease 1 n=1 Tax=Huberarchaeum crystalense TaxID=2014257 RepID=A0A2G9LJV1_HUBC1|nr:flap endonuclease-1 [archaeon]OIP20622.1 MAG: hypothetical protein AUJ91_00825 [archaeon CG2_30_31_98]PIN66833.1 MAG: flap endonuclease-1 [Candidatus Huberarchaeum crystalense]NCS98241.1 flap endonuclease-1 [archaeon]PIV13649.1 MAG: flap endonuclease-1 [Candidatus Huberarchaeum crystalense]
MGTSIREILSFEPKNIEFFRGKTLAVDAFNVIYQFITTIVQFDGSLLMDAHGNITSHLSGLFYRNAELISKGIKLIYVFDGEYSEYKDKEIAERVDFRKEADKKRKEALAAADFEEARKFAKRAAKITPAIIEESKKLLSLMGIPWIQALGEGEAQATQLVKKGKAFAAVTQDYDAIVLGCPRVVRNLNKNKDHPIEYFEFDKISKELGINQNQLVEIALLVGTDYNDGIKNIGPKKALKIVKENKFYETWCEYYVTLRSQTLETVEAITIARKEADLLKSLFLEPAVSQNVEIPEAKGNINELREFLLGAGFSESRISSTIEKLFPSQKTLF